MSDMVDAFCLMFGVGGVLLAVAFGLMLARANRALERKAWLATQAADYDEDYGFVGDAGALSTRPWP